jgi:DNA-binding CsgD family transcriptional regulator
VDPITLTVVATEGDPDRPVALLMRDDAGREYRVALDTGSGVRTPAPTPPAPEAQLAMAVTPLSPREIQAAVRAGRTAQEIADTFGVDLDRVRRYEGPILLERAHIAQTATLVALRRRTGPEQLGEIVAERLARRGDDTGSLEWDAWRRDDGRWTVQATWLALGADIGSHNDADLDEDDMAAATWIYDHAGRTVVPDDAAARGLVEEEQPAPAAPPAPRSAPGGDPYEGMRPASDDLTALADATAPTPPSESSARGGWTPVIVDGGRRDADFDIDVDKAAHEQSEADTIVVARDNASRIHIEADEVDIDDALAESDDADSDDSSDVDDNQDVPELKPEAPADEAAGRGRRRTSVPSWDEILFGSNPSTRPE